MGTRLRTGGELKWKLANAVGSQYSSHYLGTRCIQHYYRWYAHLGCQQSTELTATDRFKWTRPFRLKNEIWFLRVCHHISIDLCYYSNAIQVSNFISVPPTLRIPEATVKWVIACDQSRKLPPLFIHMKSLGIWKNKKFVCWNSCFVSLSKPKVCIKR